MRITALLLALVLTIAPFSGAMAMAGGAPGTATDTVAMHHDDMPCHGKTTPASTPCDNCAQPDCNLLDCEHCANAVFGIPASMALASGQQAGVQYHRSNSARISTELPPDSPPPIA
jgi:hypothetical protein